MKTKHDTITHVKITFIIIAAIFFFFAIPGMIIYVGYVSYSNYLEHQKLTNIKEVTKTNFNKTKIKKVNIVKDQIKIYKKIIWKLRKEWGERKFISDTEEILSHFKKDNNQYIISSYFHYPFRTSSDAGLTWNFQGMATAEFTAIMYKNDNDEWNFKSLRIKDK